MVAQRNEIKSGKIYIKDVFDEWYTIPEYQRPYVWERDDVIDLLDDISYAAQNNPNNEYFLGSYVYQHKPKHTNQQFDENDLLDGQQRITTLFLLFAVIRDIEVTNKKRKENCQKYIFQEEDKDTNTPGRIRLLYKIRPEVEKFIEDYIMPEKVITTKLKEIENLSINSEDISIKNMASAIIEIKTYFEDNKNIDTFFPYLLNNVLLIYVYSEKLEDAYRLFTILNDRGVKLRNSDILKAENLQQLTTEKEKVVYAKQWEDMEGEFGEDFDRFLSYIRTIILKDKARLSLLDEFEKNIYHIKEKDPKTGKAKEPLVKKGKETFEFLNNYYKHYDQLFENDNFNFNDSYEFYNLLYCMRTALPSTDWIPPLLFFYNKFKSDKINIFIRKLDNKFSGDWINQLTPTERIENMNAILKGIDGADTEDDLFKTELFKFDKDDFFKNLFGKVYGRQYAKYILLKLDYIYNDNKTTKWGEFSRISVEHILPQKPQDKSQWKKDFTDEERADFTDKLGNLILLGRGKNASQGRLDYIDKHRKYFANNINTFPNSLRIFNKYSKVWTKKELLENQDTVISKLSDYYKY